MQKESQKYRVSVVSVMEAGFHFSSVVIEAKDPWAVSREAFRQRRCREKVFPGQIIR